MRVTKRSGRPRPLASTRVQAGAGSAPVVVVKTAPSLWPTQIRLEWPGATAMALIGSALGALMAVQAGVGAFAFVLRHRLQPPPRRVLGLLGSRIKGAMKLAHAPASVRPLVM